MRRLALLLLFAGPAVVLGVMSQMAGATHVRPKGASPIRVSLVPAFKACAAPNRTHGAPLAFPSCNPPVQSSNFLTVGTPDANGAAASSTGFLLLKVKTTSPEDILFSGTISDVRCLPGTAANVCNTANSADGPDYSGRLQSNATIRVSDHYNGPSLTEAATLQDIPFPINFVCSNTPDTAVGGTCNVDNQGPVVCPECGVKEGVRTVVGITQFEVFDGGADGDINTASGDTVFMRQGIFIP
jgi:hypothetical protein